MGFFKLIKYDIKQGFLYNKIKFIIFFILIIIICIAFRTDATRYTKLDNFFYADYILYIIEGARQLPMTQIKDYVMPIMWIGIQALIGYIVGYYPMDDLYTYGQQILIRSGSRVKWWISKCVWNIVMVFIAYCMVYIIPVIFSLVVGDSVKIAISQECIDTGVFKTTTVQTSNIYFTIMFFVMPFFVSTTISLVQMMFSIIISPLVGFIIAQAIMFGSTLFPYKYLLGNYSMFAKSKICGMTDINIYEGICINILLFIGAIIIGMIYLSRCNILSKEEG